MEEKQLLEALSKILKERNLDVIKLPKYDMITLVLKSKDNDIEIQKRSVPDSMDNRINLYIRIEDYVKNVYDPIKKSITKPKKKK